MLQLPATTKRACHFTKAEIANIAGAAKVTKRAAKPKADPIIKATALVRTAYDRYVEVSEAIEELKSKHDAKVFRHAAVYLPSDAIMLVTLNANDSTFITERGIDRWVKKHREHYQNESRANKKPTLKLAQTAHAYTRKQALERLHYVNKLGPLLKTALRKREREINRTWREIGYSQLRRKCSRALVTYEARLQTLLSLKPQGVPGARSIIDMLSYFTEYEEEAFKAGATYGQLDIDVRRKLLMKAAQRLGAAQR